MQEEESTCADVRMTPEAIAQYNRRIRQLPQTGLLDLDELREHLSGALLRAWICAADAPDREPCFLNGRPLHKEHLARLRSNRALERIPPVPKIAWGLCTERCALRILPMEFPMTGRADERYDDWLQESAVLPGEPVALLHTSEDGGFFYAAVGYGRGWIPRTAVGLCPDWAAFQTARAAKPFLTVTGSRVILEQDPWEPRASGRVLTMGTRLPLAAPPGTVEPLRGRMSYDNYLVELPARDAVDMLCFVKAMVPVSARVQPGFVPYTDDAVMRLADGLRGEVYGWGGRLGGRDCSSLVMELYRCFGFALPRGSAGLARLPDSQELSGLSVEEKRALLRTQPPGTLLYFPGHVMLFCGEQAGRLLCISAAGNFQPPGSAGGWRAVNTVVRTPLDVVRANGESWLASLTRLIRIG